MDGAALLLRVGFRHPIDAPNADEAAAMIAALAGRELPDFHVAIAACLTHGWIEEPVRLEDHALHCHWRLVLTPAGVTEARRLTGA
jgi:hypothetical protein